MAHPASAQPMAFFGRYLEVTPHTRLVWTNDEGPHGETITTVVLTEAGTATQVTVQERYPSAQALDEALSSGSTTGWGEQFDQLDTLLTHPHAQA